MRILTPIIDKVYNGIWLIKPSAHQSIQKQLESILTGKAEVPDVEDPDEEITSVDLDEMLKELETEIAVVPVDGVIGKRLSRFERMFFGGADIDDITANLKSAAVNPDVSKIVMYYNSPGGTVTGVPELGQLIKEIDEKKPVISFTDTLMASAAYWLASQARFVYAAPSADVGSVGVYSLYADATRFYENEGIKVNAISAGKYKLTGADFKVMSDEERTMLQADVDKIYNEFKRVVKNKRPNVSDEDLQGQVFDGETAVTKNLIDGNINSLDDLLQFLTE